MVQLFELAKLYAQNHDDEAKQLIYDRFFVDIINGADWIGYEEIIELDKFEGLIFIADRIGKYIQANPEDWQDDYIISHFQENYPEINALRELERVSMSNENIKIYLENITKTKKKREQYKKQVFDFQALIKHINDSKKTYISPAFTKKLSSEELKKLADNFLAEKDIVRKEKYLSIFTRSKYPYNHNVILEMAKSKPNNTNRIVEFAVSALSYFKAENIRDFALEKLNLTKSHDLYTDLLINNYSKGDAELLKSIVEKHDDEFIIENLACSYEKIYKMNKTKECLEPLSELYKKMNCGIHRNSLLEILLENDVLPLTVKREIEFDSYEESRQLYKNIK